MTGSRGGFRRLVSWLRVGTPELLACALDGKHPVDTSALAIAPPLPVRDLGHEHRFVGDSAVEALPDHDPDFDLDHVEPAGVLGRVVEFEAAQDSPRFGGVN